MRRDLDRIDRKILSELQQNGRLSVVDLSSRVNLTNTPCAERVKRLEKSGMISKYKAVVNPDQLGLSHLTIVHISMAANADVSLNEFNTAVTQIDEVETCMMIAGSFDYMLIVRTRDMAHFRDVIGEKLSKLPGIRQTNSFAVMEVVKNDQDIAFSINT